MSLRGQRAGTRSLVSMDRYLIATVGAMRIAVSAETVAGLLTIAESGSIEAPMVQGQLYAAVDLAARLGVVPEEDGPDTRVILLAQGTARASVRVASVHGLIECEGRRVLPLPRQFRGEERGWYGGLLLFGEGVAIVLQTQWLLGGAEALSSSGRVSQGYSQSLVSNTAAPAVGRGMSC